MNKDDKSLHLKIENENYELPEILLDLEDLHSLFSLESYEKTFNSEEKKHLESLLPKDISPSLILRSLFSGETFYMSNPMDSFLEKLKSGCFSHYKQQEIELQKKLYNHLIIKHFENISEELVQKLEDTNFQKTFFLKRKNSKMLEDLFTEESDEEKLSISALSIENSFSGLSPGYSTPISLSEEPILSTFPKKFNEINFVSQENRMIDAKKMLFDPNKVKKTLVSENTSQKSLKPQPEIKKIFPVNTNKSTNNQPNNSSSLTNNSKKPQRSVISKEWIDNFRSQESERYANPTRPFTYVCADGSKGVVAPVSKKIAFASATKPRDHFLLKAERPPYITILCLVRDAASRLPGGFGTRADICELLKESQFINENVPDDKLSNIVSGALDRLHYEDDACVKYDPEKKLWIYLHKDRTENYLAWMEQNDSRSSKKKEYNQKYKNKKRVKIDDNKSIIKI